MTDTDLYFRQLLSGRDFATDDPLAQQMVNFVYAIGDRSTGECLIVDPAYAVDDLIAAVGNDGMTVTGALVTHYHPDHVGGSMMGHTIEGIAALLERVECPIHLQRDETEWVAKSTGVSPDHFVQHESGDTVAVGGIDITLLHTPGTRPEVSASSSTADSSPGTPCSSRDAGGPIYLVRTRPTWRRACAAWPRCPTTRSCSLVTATRWRAAPPWTSSRT